MPLLLVVLGLAVAAALLVGEIGAPPLGAPGPRPRPTPPPSPGAAVGEAESPGGRGRQRRSRRVLRDRRQRRSPSTCASATPGHGERRGVARRVGDAPGGGDRSGLAPAMLAALARADALLGRPVEVVAGAGLEVEVSPIGRVSDCSRWVPTPACAVFSP